MRSYDAARGSFGLFEFLARLIIVVGILAAVGGGGLAADAMGRNMPPPLASLLGALPGVFIAVAGFFGLATAQMGRAAVDSAEYAQQSLSVSRQQLELSQEALAQGKATAASYAALLKQQSPERSKASSEPYEADQGPSYADQTSAELSETAPETGAKTAIEPPKENTVPEKPIVAEIEHKDGLFHINGETFKTMEEAKSHHDMLTVETAKEIPS